MYSWGFPDTLHLICLGSRSDHASFHFGPVTCLIVIRSLSLFLPSQRTFFTNAHSLSLQSILCTASQSFTRLSTAFTANEYTSSQFNALIYLGSTFTFNVHRTVVHYRQPLAILKTTLNTSSPSHLLTKYSSASASTAARNRRSRTRRLSLFHATDEILLLTLQSSYSNNTLVRQITGRSESLAADSSGQLLVGRRTDQSGQLLVGQLADQSGQLLIGQHSVNLASYASRNIAITSLTRPLTKSSIHTLSNLGRHDNCTSSTNLS